MSESGDGTRPLRGITIRALEALEQIALAVTANGAAANKLAESARRLYQAGHIDDGDAVLTRARGIMEANAPVLAVLNTWKDGV